MLLLCMHVVGRSYATHAQCEATASTHVIRKGAPVEDRRGRQNRTCITASNPKLQRTQGRRQRGSSRPNRAALRQRLLLLLANRG